MNPDFTGDLIIHIGLLGAFMLILCVGCVIADYLFPHIPFLQRWLDSMTDYEDREGEEERMKAGRKRRDAKRRKHGRF